MEANSGAEFEEYAKSSNIVWKHFLRSPNRLLAKCKICKVFIKTSGRSTSGLHTHLRTKHGINTKSIKSNDLPDPVYSESTPNEEDCVIASTSQSTKTTTLTLLIHEDDVKEPPAKKSKITDYFEVIDSVSMRVSRMVAKDGFPFTIFANSPDMRLLFVNAGYILPKSIDCIKEMVMKYGSDLKKRFTQQFSRLKTQNGQKFNLTINEWTSTGNRRYLNLNIQTEINGKAVFWHIGLIRITERLPAEICVNIFKSKLQEFGLNLETDIVVMVTDGASIMEKIGRLIGTTQQLCCARIFQQTILDIFYVSKKEDTREYNSEDSEDELDEFYNDKFIVSSNTADDEKIEVSLKEYKSLINKMRKITILFKKSKSKSTLLRNYVTQELDTELELILDTKNCWSSLVLMSERFIQLKSCIYKIQVDLKLGSEYCLSEEEFDLIIDMYQAFQPIKLAVEGLCKKDATFITAEKILASTVDKLHNQKTRLCQELASALRIKIKQRDLNLTGVLMYLHTPKKYIDYLSDESINDTPLLPNKSIIVKEIIILLEKLLLLHPSSDGTNDMIEDGQRDNENDISDDDPLASSSFIIKAEPEDTVVARNDQTEIETVDSPLLHFSQNLKELGKDASIFENIDHHKTFDEVIIKKEMAAYETGGIKGKHLEIVYKYLLSIPPTSIDADTAFSATCNKIHSSLDDKTIGVLFFLRKYFLSNNKHF